MIKDLIETFRKPSAEVLAQRELEDAKRALLESQRMHEYHFNMVAFNKARIGRLSAMLRSQEEPA